ncbi:MAG TPA: MSMEG_1061 family FMN-dependent PPOX-type flavoprotein [Solirubrobacteraceae bacterium]|nr:MSMEG_1061 family FMN-dependent PPOX-type flavoprotein [Solirubrobacteraceae bacterium]
MSTARAIHRITDEDELRELIGGGPTDLVMSKIADHVNDVTRRFIEASPYVCVATARPGTPFGARGGGLDVSPRGDPPGFVRVLDERTLFLPERPGNRIADTLTNLLHDDRIALLFLIPGVVDTFRVQGRAVITDDPELLAGSEVEGKLPRLGLVITIQEAYTQCPKASIRSSLWDPSGFVDRASLPSGGEVLRSLRSDGFDAETYDRERAGRYARGEGLY